MKKILVSVFVSITVLTLAVFAAQAEAFLRLPVRVLSGDKFEANLTIEDFNLLIDGQKKEIAHFIKMNRSLSGTTAARNFVLAFNTRDYKEQVADGISYFVKNILKEGDSLLLWSPVKVYVIQVSTDKNKIIETIQSIVKKDSLQFKQEISNGVATLNEIIKKYRADCEESNANPEGKTPVGSLRTISQVFLSNYSREIKNFKDRYILPNLLMNRKVAELLAEKNGQKYIINFQEREIIPNIVEYQKVAAEITRLADTFSGNDMTNATRMYRVLDVIEKSMLISESLPKNEVTAALLAANISYNVILFKSSKERTTIGDTVSPDVDTTFSRFAKLTGGAAVTDANLPKALEIIRKHNDIYYDLIFKIDGPPQEKAISLNLTKKSRAKLYYKELFTLQDIQSIFGALNQSRIQLTDIDLKEQQLKFSISGYQLNAADNKEHGLVKVLVNLFDQENKLVYKTQKTMDAQEKSIDFSLELPAKYKGDFTLSINAVDLISMKSTQFNQLAKL